MLVSDVMSRAPEFIGDDAPVQQAAVLMGELNVGALPVGSDGTLRGVLTDRDILFRVVAEGRDARSVPVGAVMSKELFDCRAGDTVQTALATMGQRQVRRLPVRDADGRLVGWLTLSDIARRLLVEPGTLAAELDRFARSADPV